MTKTNRQESAKAMYMAAMGEYDIAARIFATCIRSARTTKERNELITEASAYPAVIQNAEFTI